MITPLTEHQTMSALVDSISARSQRLRAVFAGSFTTEEAMRSIDRFAGEIEEATKVLRRRARAQIKRVA